MTPARVVILLWLAVCAMATHKLVPVWSSESTLWAHAVRLAPTMPRALINHGKALIAEGERERGIEVALVGYNEERRRQDAKLADRAAGR